MTKTKTKRVEKDSKSESPERLAMRREGYVPAAEAARATNRAKSTISQHCTSGNITSKRVGRTVFVLWASLVDWITNGDPTTARTLGLSKTRLPG